MTLTDAEQRFLARQARGHLATIPASRPGRH